MSDENVIRLAAVVAAVALLAAPYWDKLAGWLSQAAEAAYAERATLTRIAGALLLIAAAWGKIPMPRMPSAPAVTVDVETPSVEMQQLVKPVADALVALPVGDRMLWAATWQKAGVVVKGDGVTAETAFTDTRSLRSFTALAVDIAWRRIGGKAPGSVAGLRDAVEEAYNACLGLEVVPVDVAMRDRYDAFARAIAWAGVGKE